VTFNFRLDRINCVNVELDFQQNICLQKKFYSYYNVDNTYVHTDANKCTSPRNTRSKYRLIEDHKKLKKSAAKQYRTNESPNITTLYET